jgi:hypothetical protein
MTDCQIIMNASIYGLTSKTMKAGLKTAFMTVTEKVFGNGKGVGTI